MSDENKKENEDKPSDPREELRKAVEEEKKKCEELQRNSPKISKKTPPKDTIAGGINVTDLHSALKSIIDSFKPPKTVTVLTHGGPAHQDEFIACCLLIAKYSVEATELKDEDITYVEILRSSTKVIDEDYDYFDYLIDVGGQHDPKRGLFDHHQLPNAGNGTCSLHLLAESLELDLSIFP